MIELKKKTIYFGDIALTSDVEDIQEEFNKGVLPQLVEAGLVFKTPVVCVTMPPFKEDFEVLLFDYGGMSLGNSMLEHFCEYIIKHAEEHPNRHYIMVSQMTELAMQDALREFKSPPHNVFLGPQEYRDYLKKHPQEAA